MRIDLTLFQQRLFVYKLLSRYRSAETLVCWASGGGGDMSYIAHTKNHIVYSVSQTYVRHTLSHVSKPSTKHSE